MSDLPSLGEMVPFASLCQMEGVDTDIYSMVARLAGISRKDAKIISLGLAYGMGVSKLARSLGLSLEESQQLLDLLGARRRRGRD